MDTCALYAHLVVTIPSRSVCIVSIRIFTIRTHYRESHFDHSAVFH